MFGKRSGATTGPGGDAGRPTPVAPPPSLTAAHPPARAVETPEAPKPESRRSDEYYQTKSMIFGALIEAIDLAQLSRLDGASPRAEIRDIVSEIIALKNV